MRKGSVLRRSGWCLVLMLGGLCGLSACVAEDTGAGSASPEVLGLRRGSFTATLLPGGEVLVVGGSQKNVSMNSVQLYNPRTRAWRDTGSLREDRYSHTSLLLPSGRVLVMGGSSWAPESRYPVPLGSMELYEPATGLWSSRTAGPSLRSLHQVTLLRDGRIMVTGGFDEGNPKVLASVETYDPETDRWSVRASMGHPRAGHSATLLPDGRVLVVGGEDSPTQPDTAEIYDPATDTWSQTSALSGRYPDAIVRVRHDGQVLLLRGEGPGAGKELYDPTRDTWTVIPDRTTGIPFVDLFSTKTLLPDGRILFVGRVDPATPTDTLRFYHSETYAWSSGSPMPEPRSGHEAVLLANGKVLLLGGWSGSGDLASPVATYDPRTDTWE